MIETEPKVFLVSEPMVVIDQMAAYLREVGGTSWYERVVAPVILQYGKAGATELIEFCGRLCYRSWEPGLNKNVTKVRRDTAEYILNILTSRHGSVTEHAHFTFVFRDVSRVFTAEWNRHRHPNISEQSLRFVRLDTLRFRLPPVLPDEVLRAGQGIVEECEKFLAWAAEYCGLDNEGDEFGGPGQAFIPFAEKKVITSALRRFAPLGLSTDEAWTADLRDIRHIIESRTDFHAEEEVRIVADKIATIMAERAPFFFQDYELVHDEDKANDGVPRWETPYRKV